MASLPFLAFLYAGRRSARAALAATVAGGVVVGAYELIGDDGAHGTASETFMRASGMLSAAFMLYFIASKVESLRDEVVLRLNDQREALEHELAAHEQTRLELERATEQRTEAARAARAAIASGVLHNVGNALNSAKVSAGLLDEARDESVAERLERLVAHLAAEDVPRETLATYLSRLATSVRASNLRQRNELAQLRDRLHHIERVVQAQQAHARSRGVREPLDLAAAGRQAVAIAGGDVTFDIDVPSLPTFVGERHKVLQILTNLVSNARDAVGDAGRVRITGGHEDGRVWVEVADDGVGIDEETLPHIFEYGFTTKRDGHGFGLHASALCATQLGGQLEAHSDGPGKGAAFRLVLPLAG